MSGTLRRSLVGRWLLEVIWAWAVVAFARHWAGLRPVAVALITVSILFAVALVGRLAADAWLRFLVRWAVGRVRGKGVVACGALRGDGSVCRLPAGWETEHPGAGLCRMHEPLRPAIQLEKGEPRG